MLGCKVVKTAPFTLPDDEHSERNIAVMQKIAFTPKTYPRHGGTITKKPLFLEKAAGLKQNVWKARRVPAHGAGRPASRGQKKGAAA